MDFTFSAEQEELRSSVRGFMEREAGSSYVRQMIDDDAGFTSEMWTKIAELGWAATLVPAEAGGMGLGLVDMVVILEEMGRLPFPGPFLSSAVLATRAAVSLGLHDLYGPLAAGDQRGTVALEEYGHGDPVERVRAKAHRKGDGWELSGAKVVLDGHTADWALVAARTDTGLGTFLLERPGAELQPSTDVCRKVTLLRLDGRRAERVGSNDDHTLAWRRVADDGAVALAAELIGTMEQAHHLAVEYAKQREQFGRPIATFQAIKHKAAEMLHRLTLARVGTEYAAWCSDVDHPDREVAAAMAKSDAGEAAVYLTGESIQIHGGVGFTWDCDAHLHYRRAKANDVLLGGQSWHRSRVAARAIQPA